MSNDLSQAGVGSLAAARDSNYLQHLQSQGMQNCMPAARQMSIYTMCVDDATGRAIAISSTDPRIRFIGENENAALASLVRNTPGITITSVVSIPTGYPIK